MTYHVTNTDNPIDFPAPAKGWRKRQIENLRAAAELHAGDGGYEEGTQEEYEAFVAKRNQSINDYLIRAERYVEARGDHQEFKNVYGRFREQYNITDSVWNTLSYMYSDHVADLLKYQ